MLKARLELLVRGKSSSLCRGRTNFGFAIIYSAMHAVTEESMPPLTPRTADLNPHLQA